MLFTAQNSFELREFVTLSLISRYGHREQILLEVEITRGQGGNLAPSSFSPGRKFSDFLFTGSQNF